MTCNVLPTYLNAKTVAGRPFAFFFSAGPCRSPRSIVPWYENFLGPWFPMPPLPQPRDFGNIDEEDDEDDDLPQNLERCQHKAWMFL